MCVWNVEELDDSLDTLKAAFEKATSEKLRCQDEVNRTNNTIKLANRLVKGLEVRIQYSFFVFWQYLYVYVVILILNAKLYYTRNYKLCIHFLSAIMLVIVKTIIYLPLIL